MRQTNKDTIRKIKEDHEKKGFVCKEEMPLIRKKDKSLKNKKLLGIFTLGAAIGFAAGSFARIRIAKIKAKKRKKSSFKFLKKFFLFLILQLDNAKD